MAQLLKITFFFFIVSNPCVGQLREVRSFVINAHRDFLLTSNDFSSNENTLCIQQLNKIYSQDEIELSRSLLINSSPQMSYFFLKKNDEKNTEASVRSYTDAEVFEHRLIPVGIRIGSDNIRGKIWLRAEI